MTHPTVILYFSIFIFAFISFFAIVFESLLQHCLFLIQSGWMFSVFILF